MKLVLLLLLFYVFNIWHVSANTSIRNKRQASASAYSFPGPRTQRQTSPEEYYNRKPQYEDLINQYEPAPRTASAQTYNPSHAAPQQGYSPRPYQPDSYSQPSQPSYRPRSQYPKETVASYGNVASGGRAQNEVDAAKEEEENKKPDRLALLLQDSKFACSEKKDGYYADDSVGCQIFHYCVSGAKHSWQCPEGTVFHQVHLNCVPASQDICKQSSKFYVVNDYLYKPLDQRGPNNTIRYHQRYYPEEYARTDPLLNPNLQSFPAVQSFGYGPAPKDDNDAYEGPSSGGSRSPSSYPQSYPQSAPRGSPQPAPRPAYRPVARPAAPAPYAAPDYSSPSSPSVSPTQRPSYRPSGYGSSGSSYQSEPSYGSPDSSYASSAGSGYSPSLGSQYQPQPSSGYSSPSNSNYPSSSGSSGYTPYKPPQSPPPQASAPKPPSSYPPYSSYPSSQSFPSVGFRVSGSPNYGSSPQATRIRTAASPYASPSRYSYPSGGDFSSGVKYDEDY